MGLSALRPSSHATIACRLVMAACVLIRPCLAIAHLLELAGMDRQAPCQLVPWARTSCNEEGVCTSRTVLAEEIQGDRYLRKMDEGHPAHCTRVLVLSTSLERRASVLNH